MLGAGHRGGFRWVTPYLRLDQSRPPLLRTTNLKGVSSMKLHRDLNVTQKTAWHLAHRIRKAWKHDSQPFAGPVEADETHFGGLEKNKHAVKKLHAGRGAVGKTAVVGMKDRTTGQVTSQVVESTDAATLQGFVKQHTEPGAVVYIDEATAYQGSGRKLELGGSAVELRHAPRWQLTAPHRLAGEAVRVLAWLGPEEVDAGLEAIRPKLSAKDMRELAASRAVMPAWMAEPVSAMVADRIGQTT